MHRCHRSARATGILVVGFSLIASGGCGQKDAPPRVMPPPAGAIFDYQLGGDGPLPEGAEFVVRQWSTGEPAADVYSACYVNAFQTEADPDAPDGPDGWPATVDLLDLEDPDWPGEHPIDISTANKRRTAADAVAQRLDECADRGFRAVEFDNLDSFTRYPTAPFDVDDTIAYATLLVERAHARGLAAAQKNTPELLPIAGEIGFDFAIVEECGRFDECEQFADVYDGLMFTIEYEDVGFEKACEVLDGRSTVIRRDLELTPAAADGHVYRSC